MKTTIAILATAILCACNTTHFESTKADGTKIAITNTRFIWATENYSATVSTNGASLTANKSNVDNVALGTIVSAAVSAAAKSVVP